MKQRRLRSFAAIGLAVVTCFGVVACAPPAVEPETDESLVVAVGALPLGNWDPSQGALTTDMSIAFQAVMSPLFYWDPSGQAIPALATGYVVSDDRTSVDITLREGVTFSDGTAMDAEGVKAYFDHLLASDSYAFKATAVSAGAEFTVLGDHSLRLSFAAPIFHPEYQYWDIIRLLLVTAVLSPASIDDPERATTESMSVGPYLIDDYVPDVSISLVRNPDYWDPEAYPFDTLELIVLADPIAQLNALKSGQVNATAVTLEQAAEAEASGFQLESGVMSYYTLVVRDPESSTLEPLRDVRVRQAMMLAFDREQIAESLDLGYGRASSQAFIEGQPEYIEGGDERFGYDLERARELMAEAGYADGFDVVIPTTAALAPVQPIVEQSLGDIGIRVTFEAFPDFLTHLTAAFGGEYPLNFDLAANINTLRLLDEEFAGIGRQFDQNPDLQRLLPLIKFGDSQESADASQELGELLLDGAWLIPFSRPPYIWASVPGVEIHLNDTVGGPSLTDFAVAD